MAGHIGTVPSALGRAWLGGMIRSVDVTGFHYIPANDGADCRRADRRSVEPRGPRRDARGDRCRATHDRRPAVAWASLREPGRDRLGRRPAWLRRSEPLVAGWRR